MYVYIIDYLLLPNSGIETTTHGKQRRVTEIYTDTLVIRCFYFQLILFTNLLFVCVFHL